MNPTARPPRRFPAWLSIAAVAALIAFLTTNRLGVADVCGSNEAIEAVFVQQMVEHGKMLFPLDNGRDPMYKPPLFHWTAVALDRLLSAKRVTPFNLRLPSALYAVAGATLTMVFATVWLGADAAVMSGLVLGASYEYVSQGRYGRVDMTLTFFETLSLITFAAWFESRDESISPRARSPLHYLLAASLGLGVLAKGPVGALIPGMAILFFLTFEHKWIAVRELLRPIPVLIGAAIASSWYLACFYGRRYGFLTRQLGSENFGRFFGALGRMALGYYVQPLLLNAGPLSLLVPVIVVFALMHYRHLNGEPVITSGQHAARIARLLAIFWITTVIFFEIAAYKRKAYLLPLWPASALLIGWWIYYRALPRFGRIAPRAVAAICVILIVANFFYIPWREVRDCGARLSVADALAWPFEGQVASEQIATHETDSYRRAGAEIERAVGKEESLCTYGFSDSLEPLLFYLHRNVIPLAKPPEEPDCAYLIVPGAVWSNYSGQRSIFTQVLVVPHGSDGLILLRRGSGVFASGRRSQDVVLHSRI